jgi:hypothetical protein
VDSDCLDLPPALSLHLPSPDLTSYSSSPNSFPLVDHGDTRCIVGQEDGDPNVVRSVVHGLEHGSRGPYACLATGRNTNT